MKIGVCRPIEEIEKVEKMGFDYIEPLVTSVADVTEEQFEALQKRVANCAIRCEAFNVLFPPYIRLTGEDADEGKMLTYLNRAFSRVKKLGGEVVVFGSGNARRRPDGVSQEEARGQIVKAARLMGKVAADYGLTVVIEPLNSGETNTINSVADGFALMKEVNHPNVRLLADFYHVRRENEDMQDIAKTEGALMHLHIANSHGRIYPLERGEDEYAAFFEALKKVNYDRRLSIEGSTDDFDKYAPLALTLLRQLCR